MLVDSHCHLNFPDFKSDLPDVIRRAKEAGVGIMQTICTETSEFEEVYAIAEANEGVYASVGVHPNDSGKEEIVDSKWLIEQCSRKKVIGIGETGLDYHYEHTDRNHQKRSFYQHIIASRETGVPLIIHTRDADDDMASILSSEITNGKINGVLHCFTSSKQLADKVVELGLYISLSGIISFKSATPLHEAIRDVPLDRLLVETDAPYLAPIPFRGKRNEPAHVVYTNRVLASIKGVSEAECARITTENFFRLFSKASL
jgi:TatD DNase family protein